MTAPKYEKSSFELRPFERQLYKQVIKENRIKKDRSPAGHNLTYRLQPVFTATKIFACAHRHKELLSYLCMSPDLAINALLTFPHPSSVAKTEVQWHTEQSSFITVAGPCRILTCFHLSSGPTYLMPPGEHKCLHMNFHFILSFNPKFFNP